MSLLLVESIQIDVAVGLSMFFAEIDAVPRVMLIEE